MTIFNKPLPPTPVLETERLVLRPVAPGDAPTLQRRFPRWEIVRFLSTRVPWPYPPDGAERYVVLAQEEMARGDDFMHRLVERAQAMGGTCTGEHGIGQGKQKYLEAELGSEALDAMRALKKALDPQNVFNPCKIVPAA